MEYSHLIQEPGLRTNYFVDATDWNGKTIEAWVVYADLLGFSEKCTRSMDSTINSAFRFHKAVSAATENLTGYSLHRFTDATFLVSRSSRCAVAFAANLQNECMAFNSIILRRHHPLADHCLVPRVTIARGEVFELPDSLLDDERLNGVDVEHMLAGNGIVAAYRLESKTAAFLASFSTSQAAHAQQILKLGCTNRCCAGRRFYEFWRRQPPATRLVHDGVRDFPWPLLQPRQKSAGAFLLEGDSSLSNKLHDMLLLSDLMADEFRALALPVSVGKHHGAFKRFLIDLVQGVSGTGSVRWDRETLEASIKGIVNLNRTQREKYHSGS